MGTNSKCIPDQPKTGCCRTIIRLGAMAVVAFMGVLSQAQAQQPVNIMINAQQQPEASKCKPLYGELNAGHCDAVLNHAQTLEMRPGTTQILRLIRPFTSIVIDDPNESILVPPPDPESDALAVRIIANRVGQARLFLLARSSEADESGKMDVLFAAKIIVAEPVPPAPPRVTNVRIYRGSASHQDYTVPINP